MPFSKAQQQAIDLRNKNILVSASAGSGKTSVLVERLCKLVLVDKISIDRILAMTFTEDAANEMKDRLKKRLQAETQTDYIQSQLALLETASICTIDGFCLSIVKNYYYKIPISYKMSKSVASSAQANKAFLDAYNEVLRWYQSTSPICEEKKKILHEKKLALDSHPLVQEYLKVYNEANEPFVYLERNLLSRFRRKKKIC